MEICLIVSKRRKDLVLPIVRILRLLIGEDISLIINRIDRRAKR